jgi:hypothetical protein
MTVLSVPYSRSGGAPDGGQRLIGRVLHVRLALGRHDHHLVRHAAPERADHHDPFVFEHDAVTGLRLGLEGGAQQARPLVAPEPGLFLGDLAGHEGDAEQLPVRV